MNMKKEKKSKIAATEPIPFNPKILVGLDVDKAAAMVDFPDAGSPSKSTSPCSTSALALRR